MKMDVSEKKEGLNRRQRAAIPFLATSASFEAGCKAARISTSTGYGWLRCPEFSAALSEARDRVVGQALDRLRAALSGAVDGLIVLSQDSDKDVKRLACVKLIDFYLRVKEISEIEARLVRIERILDERHFKASFQN